MLRIGVKRVLPLALTGAALGSAYVASDADRRYQIKGYYNASYRIYNLVATAAVIAYDYKMNTQSALQNAAAAEKSKLEAAFNECQAKQVQNIREFNKLKSIGGDMTDINNRLEANRVEMNKITDNIAQIEEEANAQLSTVHTRNAKKLTEMCLQNEGIYIKLGQHLAMLDYIVPVEYQQALSLLLKNNLHSTWEEVQQVLREDLGTVKLKDFFASIEERPIASASLAQVHIGIGVDGKKYAIKVQHKDLREESVFDRNAVTFVVDNISLIFPDFKFNWLTREMNKNIPLELDFLLEADNISACRRCLKSLVDSQSVRVPDVAESMCSGRVLTMSFEEGCCVTDLKGIDKAGLNPGDVARLISTIFSEQTFRHGFVHCDPHEGNMLVRPNPRHPSQPQVVLLDHGLYRNLNTDFRHHYTRLWQGIVMADVKMMKEHCSAIGAQDLYPLLAAILTKKPWDVIVSTKEERLQSKGSKGENTMLRIYAAKYIKEINQLLGYLPSDMLLLLKTNDCLRHLDAQLGTPINTTLVITETIADVILREDLQEWWQHHLAKEDAVVGLDVGMGSMRIRTNFNEMPVMVEDLSKILLTYSGLLSRVIGMSALQSYLRAIERIWNWG